MADQFSDTEADDIAELRAYSALYTDGEPSLDALTHLLRASTGADIAMVTLLDEHHQWFKSAQSLSVSGVPHDVVYCAYVPQLDEVCEVTDALECADFKDNPLVSGSPFVRSFLGAPIVSEGCAIGTVSILGTTPRSFDHADRDALQHASTVITELLMARQAFEQLNPQPVLVDRRRWDTMLQAELANGRGHPIVGLAEVNNYRDLASDFGPDMAEDLLNAVMQCATEMSPPDGRLSRLGENIFGFTLPDMSPTAATKLVKSLQQIVTDMAYEVSPDTTATSSISCVLSRPGVNEPVNACWDRMMMGLDQAKEDGNSAFVDMIDDQPALDRAVG